MRHRWLRLAAGLLVLAGTIALGIRLGSVYAKAVRFGQYVEQVAEVAKSTGQGEEWVRAALVNRGAQLGLPVRSDAIKLWREGQRVELEVRYLAPVRLALYSVDLHFRARASK